MLALLPGTKTVTMSLPEEIGWLAASRPELGLHVSGVTDLQQLDAICSGPELDRWLVDAATLAPGVDPKTAAAYLLSIFVWRLGDILGALYLRETPLPPIDAAGVAADLAVNGRGRARDVTFRFSLKTKGIGAPLDRETFARSIFHLHAPLVRRLHERTGLSERSLWRLVTDGISAGLLEHGKRHGCVELALQEASATLSSRDWPLHNRQWRFIKIAPAGVTPEWFRLRGGCCRFYKTPGVEYCTTCVLRSAQSQRVRLEKFIASRGVV